MRQFRLKKEATPFFKEKHATEINSLDYWDNLGIDDKALEEVEDAYLTFGHKDLKNTSESLSGWDERGSHFHFSIIFPSVKHYEFDKFSNGKVVRKLMDRIQNDVNHFFSEFVNDEIEN